MAHTREGNCIVLQKSLAACKVAIPAQVFHLFLADISA